MSQSPLLRSGARRGCGLRQPGGAYLAVPLSPDGMPIEEFLIDPPLIVEAAALGLSAIGVSLIERDGITHVLDIVGTEHYPTLASFIDEARRMGISRRISSRSDFARIGPASRLLLLHANAHIENAAEIPSDRGCPCRVLDHLQESFRGMCARLWWQEPIEHAQHRLAIFASLPIVQIEVVRDPAGGSHRDTCAAAASAGVPIVEVDR